MRACIVPFVFPPRFKRILYTARPPSPPLKCFYCPVLFLSPCPATFWFQIVVAHCGVLSHLPFTFKHVRYTRKLIASRNTVLKTFPPSDRILCSSDDDDDDDGGGKTDKRSELWLVVVELKICLPHPSHRHCSHPVSNLFIHLPDRFYINIHKHPLLLWL